MGNVTKIFEQDDGITLSKIEEEHILDADKFDAKINSSNVIYQIKKYEQFVNKMIVSNRELSSSIQKASKEIIASNKGLSDSNGENQYALNLLTGALVFIGAVQLLITLFEKGTAG